MKSFNIYEYMKYLKDFKRPRQLKIIKEKIDLGIYEKFNFNPKNIEYTFCSLTQQTYPHGTEKEVLKWIKFPLKKDKFNNYYIKIGESKTMFTSHFDSATKRKKNVKLISYTNENNKFICTDGNTILGADDKAGVTVMLYMIEHNIPGLYYFFVGEEVGGIGSSKLSKKPYNLKGINRCISFNRRGTTSIITHQSGEVCCSNQFAEAMCSEYEKAGLILSKDNTGVFTDSANFIGIIEECTNISVGYYKEHTKKEYQNITYLEQLCNSSLKVNWEKLPIIKHKRLEKITENNNYNILEILKPKFVLAAQSIYDEWAQDDEGIDDIYGSGGICDDIADAICNVIHNNTNINCTSLYNEYDTHTSVYAYDKKEKKCYHIDINPFHYEKGYGYNWVKIKNVIFNQKMVILIEVPYEDFVDKNGEFISY